MRENEKHPNLQIDFTKGLDRHTYTHMHATGIGDEVDSIFHGGGRCRKVADVDGGGNFGRRRTLANDHHMGCSCRHRDGYVNARHAMADDRRAT